MTSSRIPPLGGVTEADAVAWVKAMDAADLFLPMEEDAANIINIDTDEPTFTPEEVACLNDISDRLYEALGDQFDEIAYEYWCVPRLRELAGDAWEGDLPVGYGGDELRRHRNEKLLGQLQAAGWKPDQEGLDANPVRLWLYSVSLYREPRLVLQAGAQLYRDMQSGGGVIGELAKDGRVPGDNLAAALRAYDEKAFPTAEDRQVLGMYLAQYVSSTRTWQQKPSLDEVGGVHVVVFDWTPCKGNGVLRPACCSSPVAGPMKDEDLASFFGYVLAAHVKQHPQDEPAFMGSAWYPMRPGRRSH